MSKTVWRDAPCIVAASGPSLSKEQAQLCQGYNVIAVNDAYRLFPNANTLYAADVEWWKYHEGCPNFEGEKLTCHHDGDARRRKRICKEYNIKPMAARRGSGFSLDPSYIHYGTNSGFQATNIAVVRGACPIILIGFDMQGTHFFGPHPSRIRRNEAVKKYDRFISYFHQARMLHKDLNIINATGPKSLLTAFPTMSLKEALDACGKTQS